MAFGRGSITVAMTSIASSLGKRVSVLRYDRHQSFFFTNFFDHSENLFRHFLDRPHAVHLVVDPKLLVILHQWICLFFICPEPLSHQVFAVIRAMEEGPATNVAYAFDFWSAAERVVDFAAARTYPPACKAIKQGFEPRSYFDDEDFIGLRH